MLNDKDEKYEGQEESEYHFSDEDVSYEVEPEGAKPAVEAAAEPKENFLTRLTRSKRMLISIGVFLVLVFVVYKMVAPSTSPNTQSTDITTATATMSQQTPTTKAITQAAPAQTQPQQPQMQTAQEPITIVAPQPTFQPIASAPTVVPPQTPTQATQMQATQTVPSAATIPPPTTQPVTVPGPTVVQQVPTQPITTQPITTQPITMQPMPTQTMVTPLPPSAIQPQTVTTTVVQGAPTYAPGEVTNATLNAQVPGGIQAGVANLEAQNQKLIEHLNTEYGQRLAEFTVQNKNLQDQVHTLNSRVASMESELNQLVQALLRNSVPAAPAPVVRVQAPEPERQIVPQASYNVQAIIPGRAWLRSANGETITVAEGDIIRNLGRVTKIDPYDGIVEINTGSRTISLSYGSGG